MSETPTIRSFSEVVNEVPAYDSFFDVNEHRARDETLAAEHGGVTFETFGESAAGDEIWGLTLGEGSETALMFAAPHPNEPIGCMTLDFLAHELAENDTLRESLDYGFVLVKAADPDGLRLNEGWFDGPFTLSNYAQNYYRPASDEQVEWSFPFEYGDYEFDDPVPETEALMRVIDTHEPGFIYSLHNAGFGGCYYYLSEPLESLHDVLHQIPADSDIPLHLGEPEIPTVEAFADAIYQLPAASTMFETFEQHGDRDPAEMLAGATSFDYARSVSDDVVELVVELPYFSEPRITDQTELDRSRETVVVEGYDEAIELAEKVGEQYDAVEDLLPDCRLERSIESYTDQMIGGLVAQQEWARSAEETDRPATVAQRMDARYIMQFYVSSAIGSFLRLLDQAAMRANGTGYDRLVTARRTLERQFHDTMGTLVEELDYEPIPIRRLVTVQARAGLTCLDHLQQTGHFDDSP